MTITPRSLSTDLNNALYTFFSDPLLEGKIPFVYKDGRGIPTVGVGYALIVETTGLIKWQLSNYLVDFPKADINLTEPHLADLEVKLVNIRNQLNNLSGGSNPFNTGSGSDILGWTLTEAQMQQLVFNGIPDYETRVKNWLGNDELYTNLQGSQEMFALVSFAFNNMVGE